MMKTLLLPLLASVGFTLVSAEEWQDVTSVKAVFQAYPQNVTSLFARLNLDYPGLELVRDAYLKGEVEEACSQLLLYYESVAEKRPSDWVEPRTANDTVADADLILENIFTVQNVKGRVPVLKDGHRDWNYKGPNNDNEWAWLSNRHDQLRQVYEVYLETGNPKYPDYIDNFLRDFIIGNLPYPGKWNDSPVWRGLEVALRANVWCKLFYGLIDDERMTPATKLLMLSSFYDHAHYNRHFHATGNWLTTEIASLANVAAHFPEFKDSAEWLDYSVDTLEASMRKQVYPDGVQKELTAHYHNVAMMGFHRVKNICEGAGIELPEYYNRTLESMFSYVAKATRPDGHRVLNNDGDRGSNRELILKAAAQYGQPAWEYIISNGQRGVRPTDGPSWFFPYAGQLISRSGFDENAQWSFFDVGPWGYSHQHNDKLHLSISAYGRDLLVDSGRFAYSGDVARRFRSYACGSQGHNLVLVDGQGQAPGPHTVMEPLSGKSCKITDQYDYASGSFSDFLNLEGENTHQRSLLYVRGQFWIVVDRVKLNQPGDIDVLWHWHPDCGIKLEADGRVSTDNSHGNLKMIPLGSTDWTLEMVKGREAPDVQGWYSEAYNIYEPTWVSIYSQHVEDTATFVWLLVPYASEAPKIQGTILNIDDDLIRLRVDMPGKETWHVGIAFDNSELVELETVEFIPEK